MDDCPVCDGRGEIMGHLGHRIHLRCRQCGMGFSREIKEVDEDGFDALYEDLGGEG